MDRTHMQPRAIAESDAITNDIVSAVLSQYAQLPTAPQPGKYTVLAGFTLHDSESGSDPRTGGTATRLLSLGAGAKCLPACRLPERGDALHDSHAEVIARRGAVRWLLEEVQRDARARGRARARAQLAGGPAAPAGRDAHSEFEDSGLDSGSGSSTSTWVCPRPDGRYALRDNVRLWMYVSTVPCTSPFPSPSSAPCTKAHSFFSPFPFLVTSPLRILASCLLRFFTLLRWQAEMHPWDFLRPRRTPKCP